jgi:gamma-glutamylcyclotransferase (GGCT)/AIG2-like uncharacterized protein YtfP
MTLLAVYGTLRKGHHNNRQMAEAPLILSKIKVPNLSLYGLGWYPGVKIDDGPGVVCDFYDVDEALLKRLDRYEGYDPSRPEHSLFVRKELTLETTKFNIYVYNGAVDRCERIESGDFLLEEGISG